MRLRVSWEVSESNMKRIAVGLLFISLISSASMGYAQQKGGYSTGAYSELGADDSYLDRVSDWFATAGKSHEEKALIKSRRRAMRKRADSQKAIARKKKEIAKRKKEAMNK